MIDFVGVDKLANLIVIRWLAHPLAMRFLRQHHVCLLGESEGHLDLWMADPHDNYVVEAVRLATGHPIRHCVSVRSEIDELIVRWHGQGRSVMGTIVEEAVAATWMTWSTCVTDARMAAIKLALTHAQGQATYWPRKDRR